MKHTSELSEERLPDRAQRSGFILQPDVKLERSADSTPLPTTQADFSDVATSDQVLEAMEALEAESLRRQKKWDAAIARGEVSTEEARELLSFLVEDNKGTDPGFEFLSQDFVLSDKMLADLTEGSDINHDRKKDMHLLCTKMLKELESAKRDASSTHDRFKIAYDTTIKSIKAVDAELRHLATEYNFFPNIASLSDTQLGRRMAEMLKNKDFKIIDEVKSSITKLISDRVGFVEERIKYAGSYQQVTRALRSLDLHAQIVEHALEQVQM